MDRMGRFRRNITTFSFSSLVLDVLDAATGSRTRRRMRTTGEGFPVSNRR
jgi:hypothetical protein